MGPGDRDLEPLGLLKASDRAVLVAHCEAWSRFVAAVRCYRAEGVVRINPDSGRLGKHAAVAVAEQAAVQLAKLGGLLGLSPVAERGLGSFNPPDDADDPFAYRARKQTYRQWVDRAQQQAIERQRWIDQHISRNRG